MDEDETGLPTRRYRLLEESISNARIYPGPSVADQYLYRSANSLNGHSDRVKPPGFLGGTESVPEQLKDRLLECQGFADDDDRRGGGVDRDACCLRVWLGSRRSRAHDSGEVDSANVFVKSTDSIGCATKT